MTNRSYDFKNDTEWCQYLEQHVMFPVGRENDATLLLKVRAKWYKKHVDPGLSVEEVLQSYAEKSSSERSKKEYHKQNQPNNNRDNSATNTQAGPNRSCEGNVWMDNGSTQRTGSSSMGYTSLWKNYVSDIVDTVLHAAFLLMVSLSIQPFNMILAVRSTQFSFLIGLSMHALRLIRRLGIPRNLVVLQSMAKSPEFLSMTMCMLFFMQPITWPLVISLSISALVRLLERAGKYFRKISFQSLLATNLFLVLKKNQDNIMTFGALIEISCIVNILLSFFQTGIRALSLIFMYVHILRRQYWSPEVYMYHRRAWRIIDQYIGAYIASVPTLSRFLTIAKRWFLTNP